MSFDRFKNVDAEPRDYDRDNEIAEAIGDKERDIATDRAAIVIEDGEVA